MQPLDLPPLGEAMRSIKGGLVCVPPPSVFPAKAGTQTRTLRRKAARSFSGGVAKRFVDDPPPHPLPLKGARAYYLLAPSLWERVG